MHLLFFLLLQEKDPAEESDTKAASHLKAGSFIEKDADSGALALYHYERVIDCCLKATDEDRLQARRKMHALHAHVAPNAEESKAVKWRVLAALYRNYNRRVDRKVVRYRLSDATVKNVKRGFEAFQQAVWEETRGWVKIEGKFLALDDEVRQLTPDGNDVWMHPNELLANGFPRVKDGEYDTVMVYLVGAEGLVFQRDVRVEPNWRGMRYVNFLWTEEMAEGNATGAREFRSWLWQVQENTRRNVGIEVRPPDRDSFRGDQCYSGPKGDNADEAPWRRHYAEDHLTSQMWREILCRPQAPYLRAWAVSPRFDNPDDKGLERAWVKEAEEDLDIRAWEIVQSKNDVIDLLSRARGNPRGVMYAATYLYVKKPQWVKLWLGEDASAKAFLNGEVIHNHHEHREIQADRYCIRMLLKEGRNLLLLKVDNNQDEWQFCARVTDLYGQQPRLEIGPVRK